ncbi:MAG: sn-glycerol-3-phosphate ABC transporter ATP-binding protein UgpC [Phycisphaerales bacterium]|nr:sn-glycerol-3-phosphate ABC transporter ATP-binding protein UgpC [Phycisphaerales bacterium]
MASVTLDKVSKAYRTRKAAVKAVDRFCLDVRDGEFVVLVGPSGCGKTTTLRMIAGLEEISEGVIRIGDAVVNDVPPKDRDIAMVFQNYALYPHMTAFDNMAFALKIRRMPKAEIRLKVGEVADMLGIMHLLDRKPKDLSGGERQRVAVGRAIVRRPRVFLFDEPLSNLDAKLRLHMRTEIKSLHQRLGTTCIYVTHDQEEAMTLGDRLVLMKSGVIQQAGPPMDLYTRPANRFVAGFIGSPGMNFLRLRREGAAWKPAGDDASWSLPHSRLPACISEDGEITLGVRPEHVRLAMDGRTSSAAHAVSESSPGSESDLHWPATVTVVEPLGEAMNVHARLSTGDAIVARIGPVVALTPGKPVSLRIEPRHLHFFMADETGGRCA